MRAVPYFDSSISFQEYALKEDALKDLIHSSESAFHAWCGYKQVMQDK